MKKAQRSLAPKSETAFEHRSVKDGLPEGSFSVVSMIDVLHHVDPSEQNHSRCQCAFKSKPQRNLFKDMVHHARWRALGNSIHDLILARQWVHRVPAAQVVHWAEVAGFRLSSRSRINILWYGHELLVFNNSAVDTTANFAGTKRS